MFTSSSRRSTLVTVLGVAAAMLFIADFYVFVANKVSTEEGPTAIVIREKTAQDLDARATFRLDHDAPTTHIFVRGTHDGVSRHCIEDLKRFKERMARLRDRMQRLKDRLNLEADRALQEQHREAETVARLEAELNRRHEQMRTLEAERVERIHVRRHDGRQTIKITLKPDTPPGR